VIIHFSAIFAGNYIFKRRGNWTEIFRLPLIYAALAGLSVKSRTNQSARSFAAADHYARASDNSDHADQFGLPLA